MALIDAIAPGRLERRVAAPALPTENVEAPQIPTTGRIRSEERLTPSVGWAALPARCPSELRAERGGGPRESADPTRGLLHS